MARAMLSPAVIGFKNRRFGREHGKNYTALDAISLGSLKMFIFVLILVLHINPDKYKKILIKKQVHSILYTHILPLSVLFLSSFVVV
ncbi:MAG: hypothetical protein J7642_23655 [Cyanobacteria bacterium SBC]|nr:hypothetical protein [Cyanobacteria bacterium SBC]